MAVLSREAINEAHSDHTKMDVVVPAHVVTGASINPFTGNRSGFPSALARACLVHGSSPVRTTVQVAGPSLLAPALSYRVSVGAGGLCGGRAARRTCCEADELRGGRAVKRTSCGADELRGGRAAGRTGCVADGLRGARAARRMGCGADVLRGGRAAGRT